MVGVKYLVAVGYPQCNLANCVANCFAGASATGPEPIYLQQERQAN